MRTSTKAFLTMSGVGLTTYIAFYALVCPIIGCGACTDRFADGSCASDSGPVMAHDLSGEWCEEPRPNGSELCLRVHAQQGIDEPVYEWLGHSCVETGLLTGGLEFNPVAHATLNCISSEYYSASVDWTRTGIEVFLDSGRILKLNWTE